MKYRVRFWSIKTKLTAAILFFMLIPIVIISYHVNVEFKNVLKENFIKSTTKEIIQVDHSINIYFDSIKKDTEWLSNMKEVINADETITSYMETEGDANGYIKMSSSKSGRIEEEIYNKYLDFAKVHNQLAYVYMGTENGGYIQYPKGRINVGYDPRTRSWYKVAVEKDGETAITSPYYYDGGNISIISVVKMVKDENGRNIGVQGVDVSLKGLTDIIKNIKIGNNGYIILCDKNGTIIAHPKRPELNFKSINSLRVEELNDLDKIKHDNFEIEFDGNKHLVNIYTSPKTGWKFIAVIEKSELMKCAEKIRNYILLLVLAFIFVAMMVAITFSNQFLNPILIIERQLEYISDGDFSKKLPKDIFKRADEIGNLSVVLHKMQNHLEDLIKEIKENHNFLQILIETIPNPIFYKDENGMYKHCNEKFINYLGLKRDDVIDHSVYDVVQKELAAVYYKADTELMKSRGTKAYEAKVQYADGSYHDVIFNKASYIDEDNNIKGVVGVMVDITEQKLYHEKMVKLSKLKEAMLEVSHSITSINDIDMLFELILEKTIGSIEDADIGAVLIVDEYENLKITASRGFGLKHVKEFSIELKKSFAWLHTNGNIDKTIIINDINKLYDLNMLKTEDGHEIKSTISAPIIIDGSLHGFVNLDSRYNYAFDEIDFELMEYMRTQVSIAVSKHRLYEKNIYLSRYDKLTNLYNRRYFEELFKVKIEKGIIDKEKFCVVMFDLNGLKVVNDTYGHLAGDEYIKTFAKGAKNCMNQGDILARIGGDEFVAVVSEYDLKKLMRKMDCLIEEFKENIIEFEGNKIVCGFSYGIAEFPLDGKNSDDIIKIADERMYRYKQKIKRKNG
ncbi:diguanylate cyclase [Lutibacter sp. B2]|nr:diguanylate cyclase [Lutibacter sp. B2]